MCYRSVVCQHEIHDQASRQDCRSASGHAAKLDHRWQGTRARDSSDRRVHHAFVDDPRHSEGTQGDKKEVAPIKQAKKQSIDPHLKEFIDIVILPILVKKYLVIDYIEKEVRNRLSAAQSARTVRKGKP